MIKTEIKRNHVGASIALLSSVTLLLALLFCSLYKPQQLEPDEPTAIEYEILKWDLHEIWKDGNITTVNYTIIEYVVFYEVTFNQTSKELERNPIRVYPFNFTTEKVFQSENDTFALQWALDKRGKIEVVGNFTITSTLILRNNTHLNGGNYTATNSVFPVFKITDNVTDLGVSNFYIQFEGDGSGE